MRPKILTSGQNRWTKAVTAFSSAKSGRSEKGWGSSPVGSGGFVIQKLFVWPIVRSKAFLENNRIVLQRNYNRDNNEFVEFSIWHKHTSGTLGTGQVNPGVSWVEIYHNRGKEID